MIYVIAKNKSSCDTQMRLYGYLPSEYVYCDNTSKLESAVGECFILEHAQEMARNAPLYRRYRSIKNLSIKRGLKISFKAYKCRSVILEKKVKEDRSDLYCCW